MTLLGVKNLALYIRDCESLCLSDETVKAVVPIYLVSTPGEVCDNAAMKRCPAQYWKKK